MEIKLVKQRRASGFSIVELMVAILIGLIILAGVIQVVITSKTTFIGQEEMSFIQENARYAVDLIGKDVQSAGYWGCAGVSARVAVAAKNTDAPQLLSALPVGGYDGSDYANMPAFVKTNIRGITPSGTATPVYPDVLIVRGAEGAMTGIESHDGASIKIKDNDAFGLSDNAYFVVAGEDCRRMSIVKAATVSGDEIAYNATGNCTTAIKPSLLKKTFDCTTAAYEPYLPGATVMAYDAKAYYIGNSSAINGFPALKRVILSNDGVREEELALGVEDMEILYGVAANDGNVQYKVAKDVTAAEWPLVASVQIQLVFRSQSASAQPAVDQEFLGKTYNDGFMRQLVSTTFRLRNRI